MADIKIKELTEIVEKRLFSAGKELLHDALKKMDFENSKEISPEDAICVFELMREGMHTEVSKNTMNKCLDDLSLLISKDR